MGCGSNMDQPYAVRFDGLIEARAAGAFEPDSY
jgi:hypothetical protein